MHVYGLVLSGGGGVQRKASETHSGSLSKLHGSTANSRRAREKKSKWASVLVPLRPFLPLSSLYQWCRTLKKKDLAQNIPVTAHNSASRVQWEEKAILHQVSRLAAALLARGPIREENIFLKRMAEVPRKSRGKKCFLSWRNNFFCIYSFFFSRPVGFLSPGQLIHLLTYSTLSAFAPICKNGVMRRNKSGKELPRQ